MSPTSDFLISHYCGRAELSRLACATFEVDRCTACGLVFQRAVPAGALLNDIYDRWIPASERENLHQARQLSDYRYLAGQVEFLIQYFKVKPSQLRVFDFGLGWAEWATMARSYGCRVVGAELSVERVEHARSIGIEVIDWQDIPNQEFHYINTEQVFEHLVEPRKTLEHLARSLRDDGLIKVSVPNGRGVEKRLKRLSGMASVEREYLKPVQPLEHINCFDYSSLVALGREVGLVPVRPRLRLMFNGASGWFEPKHAMKNLLRPIYRHVYPRSTFVYFTWAAAAKRATKRDRLAA
jgi:SAM-dependent methyltransferase